MAGPVGTQRSQQVSEKRTSLLDSLRTKGSIFALITALGAAGCLSILSDTKVETKANTADTSADHSEHADPEDHNPHPSAARAEKKPQKWLKRELTVVLDESLQSLGPRVEESIADAFFAWQDSGVPLPEIRFETGLKAHASLKPDGQNTILLAPIDFEGHQNDLAITIGFSHPHTGEISEADIVINSRHLFTTILPEQAQKSALLAQAQTSSPLQESCMGRLDASACDETYDLQNVLTHEVGHFFGLGENYDDPQATMFSCTSSCEIHKRDLEAVDILEISQLYDVAFEETSVSCSSHPQGPAPRRSLSWLAGLWFFSLGWLVRCRTRP